MKIFNKLYIHSVCVLCTIIVGQKRFVILFSVTHSRSSSSSSSLINIKFVILLLAAKNSYKRSNKAVCTQLHKTPYHLPTTVGGNLMQS